MKKATVVLCASLFVLSSGCVSLRTAEKYEYRSLEKRLAAVGLEPERSKDPTMAGALNILPGIGNAYLGQWGVFVANFLFWPISVVWGIPQAVIDANSINIQDTVYFYNFAEGKTRLAELEKAKAAETAAASQQLVPAATAVPVVPAVSAVNAEQQKANETASSTAAPATTVEPQKTDTPAVPEPVPANEELKTFK